jgi:predicted nucleic acid-binding protein
MTSKKTKSSILSRGTLLILDNEAIQALSHHSHPKHRRMLAIIERFQSLLQRGFQATLIVPTTVRVEALINRQDPAASFVNRIANYDHSLDNLTADHAATLRQQFPFLSVVDAHIAALALVDKRDIVLITSDTDDFENCLSSKDINIIRI